LLGVFSDAVDGSFARKTKTVSTLGKFLDPISDKIFVNGILIALVFCGVFNYGADNALTYINMTCIILMLTREFAIAAIRQIAADRNVIIAADNFGKIKTVLTFISFGAYILGLAGRSGGVAEAFIICGLIFFYAATAFSVWSGIHYYLKNKGILKLR
jgi:CDP-diacylglycerol--glycerol-3-phosphate 3-phosphatidyltransferase